MNTDEEYLTVDQSAVRLQIATETVRRMLRDGRLDGVRLGGRKAGWRIATSSLMRLLEQGVPTRPRVLPPPPPVETRPSTDERPRSAAYLAALDQAERCRQSGDLERAAHWEQAAARYAAH